MNGTTGEQDGSCFISGILKCKQLSIYIPRMGFSSTLRYRCLDHPESSYMLSGELNNLSRLHWVRPPLNIPRTLNPSQVQTPSFRSLNLYLKPTLSAESKKSSHTHTVIFTKFGNILNCQHTHRSSNEDNSNVWY